MGLLMETSPSNQPMPTTMNRALIRWNPLRELEEFQNRIRGAFHTPASSRGTLHESSGLAEWMPVVDIAEDEDEYLISAELPEVKKEDVKVTVESGMLTLSGERKFANEVNGKRYHRVERSYGSFSRSFALPEDGDPAKVGAEFKDGVLRIHVRKSEAARPKQIEVKVA